MDLASIFESIPNGGRTIMSHVGITRRNVLTFGGLAAWVRGRPIASRLTSRALRRWRRVGPLSTRCGRRCATASTTATSTDWTGRRSPALPAGWLFANSGEQLSVVINPMLAELRASHTQYYAPEDRLLPARRHIHRCVAPSRPGSHFSIGRGHLSWHAHSRTRTISAPLSSLGSSRTRRSSGGSSYRR